jgi:BirA family transcriptional regulator, biotin operon repressor / biotin---[acetyl-CoA-carboxylase] ligase
MGASTQIWSRHWPEGWYVEHVAETGSTNTDLLARASTGAPDRTVLAADHQTAGRGRLDRRWDAPSGANLLVSILFRQVPVEPGELTRRLGLAAAEAARELSGLDVGLKWPNDLVVDDAKLAGILAQRAPTGEVVVGLGLNVRWAPDGAIRLGDHLAPSTVLAAVLEAYDRLPCDITQLYRERLHTRGRRVRVELPAGEIVGRATDVEPDGRLVVLDDCGVTHRLDVGDIVHVRSVDSAG